MSNQKIIWPGIMVLLLVALVMAVVALQERRSKYPGPPDDLSIGITASEYSALVIIADERGFFKENGLAVTIREYESGYNSLTHLVQGDPDIAAATEFAFVNKALRHPGLRIITSIATTAIHELVARKDRSIGKPSDLRGKRLGVSLKTSGEFFLTTFLILNNMMPDDVTIVDLSPPGLVEALSNGEIDAALSWDIFVHQMKEELGENAISWSAQGSQLASWVLVMKKETIDARPEVVERFIRSLILAEEFVRANNPEARAILARRWNREQEYVQYIWERQRPVVSLDQPLIITMENEARWMLQAGNGDKKTVPNFLDLIYLDALDAVKPKAITIFR